MQNQLVLHGQNSLETDRASNGQNQYPQFPFTSHKKRGRHERNNRPHRLGNFEEAEKFWVTDRNRKALITEVKKHEAQTGRPIKALLPQPRRQDHAQQNAERQNVDKGNFDSPGRSAIPLPA